MDRQQDYWGHRERAEEARSLLGSPIFGTAIGELRTHIMNTLVACPPGDPAVTLLHVKLKVLDEIAGQLQHYVNEAQFKKVAV